MIELTTKNKQYLRNVIKTLLDFYTKFVLRNKRYPNIFELAVIFFYELDLNDLEEGFELVELLNYYGILIKTKEGYKINLEFFDI